MKNISLNSIILFATVIYFTMTYRLGWGETPHWLFGIIFLGLLVNIILDILNISQKLYFRLKEILLWVMIIIVLGSAFVSAIIVRHQTSVIYNVHDIIIQQESAISFLLHGKNPYAASYFNTPLAAWHYSDTQTNPALYYFVMEPFYLIFAVPFYLLFGHTIGFFDGRIPLVFLLFMTFIMAAKLVKDPSKKLLFITLLAFNPAMLGYTLEGRSDMFMFAFLFAGLYFLHKEKYSFSGILMALSFAVKQSVWPILPFYAAFLYFKTKDIKRSLIYIAPFFVTFLAITLPFFLWNPRAFMESTVGYLSGTNLHSYPISGYGLGAVLVDMGIIKGHNVYYPFQIWQIAVGLPAMAILLKFLKKFTHVNYLVLVYGIFLFVFWYFSRYLNNSHLGYLSTIFITAYFWPLEKD